MVLNQEKSSSIYSYLPFSDDRIQFLDINDWTGQAIKLNRKFYIDIIMKGMTLDISFSQNKKQKILEHIRERTENVEGIYILIGEGEDFEEGTAYIGETGNFKKRMISYFSEGSKENEDKDFCSEIFFFSKRGKLGGAGLGEPIRKTIESKIIQDATRINRFKVVNTQSNYSGRLSIMEEDAVENFYWSIKIILQHIGYTLLKEKIEVKVDDNKNYFICREKGANARMYMGDIGFVVLKDSLLIKDNTPSLSKLNKKVYELRIQLKENGILKESEDKLILSTNQEFPSATAAADFVTGGHYNGYEVWKEEENHNITLGQYIKAQSSDNNYNT
ncbi:MAG: DUF4357 domain-containing protein [Candidatus Lokiarchaeota archaeon]|nr:DUF4357 domain-containing protein [Candidatus Lokiarchaeota archaeon]